MIFMQVLLIAAFLVLAARFLSNPNSHQIKAWKKIFALLFVLGAVLAVIFPDALNVLAHLVGIGRGADLLLYALALAFMFMVFNGYVQGKREQRRFVALARRMAIIEAQNRYAK